MCTFNITNLFCSHSNTYRAVPCGGIHYVETNINKVTCTFKYVPNFCVVLRFPVV